MNQRLAGTRFRCPTAGAAVDGAVVAASVLMALVVMALPMTGFARAIFGG